MQRNLSLRDDVATGSSGFTQPHLRFTDTALGNVLTGFGLPPAANDPFKNWLQSFDVTDPNADDDCDGIANLIEYATGSDPTSASSANGPDIGTGTFSHRQLTDPGRLSYRIEVSDDLKMWQPANLTQVSNSPNGDGTSTLTYNFPPTSTRSFLRLVVTLE